MRWKNNCVSPQLADVGVLDGDAVCAEGDCRLADRVRGVREVGHRLRGTRVAAAPNYIGITPYSFEQTAEMRARDESRLLHSGGHHYNKK